LHGVLEEELWPCVITSVFKSEGDEIHQGEEHPFGPDHYIGATAGVGNSIDKPHPIGIVTAVMVN